MTKPFPRKLRWAGSPSPTDCLKYLQIYSWWRKLGELFKLVFNFIITILQGKAYTSHLKSHYTDFYEETSRLSFQENIDRRILTQESIVKGAGGWCALVCLFLFLVPVPDYMYICVHEHMIFLLSLYLIFIYFHFTMVDWTTYIYTKYDIWELNMQKPGSILDMQPSPFLPD